MKAKLLVLAFALFAFVSAAVAADATSTKVSKEKTHDAPEVHAVNDYGTITLSGDTERFSLVTDNPSSKSIACEVKVMIDGECVGQKPVIIRAGHSSKSNEYIKVGTVHKGKHYNLEVRVK